MSSSAGSHIETLPIEALVAIFTLTSPALVAFEDQREPDDNSDFLFPGTLGAVSKAWRDIIVSTPSFWTSLRWKEGKHDPMLLALYVTRSKALPLHLALSFEKPATRHSFVAPSVDSIILVNMSRIATLHLSQPPRTWLSQLGRLTSTSSISISWDSENSGPDDEVLLNKCYSLRRLSLSGGENSTHMRVFYKLPHSLEELHLTTIPLDTAIKLLLMSPNLVKFSTQFMTNPHQEMNDEISRWWFSQSFTFENLEELTWERRNNEWSRRLFPKTFAPRLRRLCLSSPGLHYIPVPPMEEENHFFRHLPETLSTLELQFTEIFSPTNSPLFDCPSLENLILRGAGPEYVVDVFKGLTPTQGNQKRLPKLRNLSILDIGDYYTGEELTPGHLQPMVSMLEQRLAKGDVFRLTFSDYPVDWTPMIQAQLKGLKAKGVQLEIVEGSDAANWLE